MKTPSFEKLMEKFAKEYGITISTEIHRNNPLQMWIHIPGFSSILIKGKSKKKIKKEFNDNFSHRYF